MMDYIKAKAIKDYRGDNLVIGFNKVEELPKWSILYYLWYLYEI